jgi:hypothetical protein
MTEADWFSCTNPNPMLDFIRSRATERLLRLFAAACCRTIWDLLADSRSRSAIEIAELAAEGLANGEELAGAMDRAREVVARSQGPYRTATDGRHYRIAAAARDVARSTAWSAASNTAWSVPEAAKPWEPTPPLSPDPHLALLAELLRDLFGNPFQPMAFDPEWRTPQVISVGEAAYAERILPAGTLERERLAILADALEDVGCTDAAILGHLRDPGAHVRGCVVVDLVLSKR